MALGLPRCRRCPSTPGPNSICLAKPTGAVCNLDCKYCFFLSKEMLYPGSRFRMADDLLETYIRQLLESQPGPDVIVGWQGGEPTLMGLDFFERSIELREALPAAGPAASTYTIQTNGTRLDDAWCAFLKRAQVPGRPERRRPARDARRLPRRQGRQGDVRRCHARRGACSEPARRRRQHPLHGQRGERRSSARGLSLLPRRAEDARSSSSSRSSSASRGDAAGGEPGLGRARQRSAAALSCSKATTSPSARSAPSSGGAS